MNDIVERVAQAITRELARQDGVEGTWLIDSDGRVEVDMRRAARAAIAAMREPSEEMLLAAGCTPSGVEPRGGVDRLRKMLPRWWRAMVDAALSPGSPTEGSGRG